MSTDVTPRLALPLIAAAQAQKHVTHNEALVALDTLSHLLIQRRDLTAPPGAADGDCYLPAAGAVGAWAGHDGEIALALDGGWRFFPPFPGLIAFIANEGTLAVFTAAGWRDYGALLSSEAVLSHTASGAESRIATREEHLTGLSGAMVETSIVIPDRSVVLCVSTRTTAAITGASSYDCGIAGEPAKFGGSLGIATGATNAGVIGPTAFYADTPVRLTANGGSFSGGAVRVALHYFRPVAPQG